MTKLKRKLFKLSNSTVFVIPKTICELFNFKPNDLVLISVKDKKITIEKENN